MATSTPLYDASQISTRRSMVLLALGALLGLGIAGYGLFTAKGTRSGGVPPEAVALINQRPVLRSDFMTQAETQYAIPFAQITHAQREVTLQNMIDEELMMQRGLEIDLPSFDPDVRNALVAGVELEVTADVLAQQPTDEELRAYYLSHRDQYASEGLLQLRDLVAKIDAAHSRETALRNAVSAAAALLAGQPVDSAMQRYGLVDSGSFVAGGHVDLGDIFEFAVRDKLDPALYRVVASLQDGEVSTPLELPDGVHVVDVVKHRRTVPQTFEQAGNRVFNDFKRDAQARVNAANLIYLHSRADILVAPDYDR